MYVATFPLADELTAAYIAKRKNEDDKNDAVYFRADPDANYAETHVIDLSKVDSMVALYPSPDNVVPVCLSCETSYSGLHNCLQPIQVTAIVGMNLDGVFIGACTTAEEDLILGALVLEAGLKLGYMPSLGGKRKVTPGSLGITAKLRRLGLLEIYERAGFEIGRRGCCFSFAALYDEEAVLKALRVVATVWDLPQTRRARVKCGFRARTETLRIGWAR